MCSQETWWIAVHQLGHGLLDLDVPQRGFSNATATVLTPQGSSLDAGSHAIVQVLNSANIYILNTHLITPICT